MFKFLFTLIILGCSAVAHAGSYTVDELIASTNTLSNSGEAEETAWVNDELSKLGLGSVEFSTKIETEERSDWTQLVEGEKIYSAALSSEPDFFLLKLGAKRRESQDSHYLFRNIGEMSLAVVDLDIIEADYCIKIGKVSHISEFNGDGVTPTPIPEPTTIMIMLSGIAGLALQRRRDSK